MKIYTDIFTNFHIKQKGIVSIGYFDSFHLGHQKIIKELLMHSKSKGKNHFVLTYQRLPKKEKNGKNILEIDDKLAIFKKIGIKNVILCDYEKNFYTLKPSEFLKIMMNNFNIDEYVIGKDFAFGYKKAGNIDTLKKLGCIYNLVEPIYINKQKVSTSYIKDLISNGKIELANKYIDRVFYINGVVKQGKQLGRKLGFPTMNIRNDNVIYPQDGVYLTNTIIKNKQFHSMTYVAKPIIETYLMDYNKFHYNFKIKVDFLRKIRDNRSFNDLKSLKNQLIKDLDKIKHFFKI